MVMRMQGLRPENLHGYERHRKREGDDTAHVNQSLSRLNERLIGREDWAQFVHGEIQRMRLANFDRELTRLRERRRTSEIERCLVEGAKEPWRPTRHGPLREVILTANAEWFRGPMAIRSRTGTKPASKISSGSVLTGSGRPSGTTAFMRALTVTSRPTTSTL
ncbi:hypothetical protein [uncultured Limimaricola sp.]|uniref:hypothetical protein n=1 Tax=uncultured Limimaricola sp. TaxID=2211667 RepID=UPI0030F6290B